MLSKREAVRIGRRGGRRRMTSLSRELRSEIASWAELVRAQRRRGEVTYAAHRQRFLHLLHSEDPDLASLLKFLSRQPARRAANIYWALPDADRALVEKSLDEVLCG